MHEALFESKIAKGLGRFIFRGSFLENMPAAKALLKTEWITKFT